MRTAKTVQTGRMPRLICVFAGRIVTLLVLSCRGSYSTSVSFTTNSNLSSIVLPTFENNIVFDLSVLLLRPHFLHLELPSNKNVTS